MPFELSGPCPLLQVFDMPTALRFYRDVLGFELVAQSGPGENFGWGLLRRRGAELMLNTAYDEGERPAEPDPARVAAHGDTINYFACEDLDEIYRHLCVNGIKANEPTVAWYGMRQLSVTDPDGFGLCFQWPATQQTYDSWVAAYGLPPKKIE
jgi:glyoxylase I family protein